MYLYIAKHKVQESCRSTLTAAKLQRKDQNQATLKKQFCSAMREYPISISHLSWLSMKPSMSATYSIFMSPPPWIMVSVPIVETPAVRYTVSITGRFRTCPSLRSVSFCILRSVSSSVVIGIVAEGSSLSSQAMRCSVTAGAPVGVKGPWLVMEYPCLPAPRAAFLPTWVYRSARPRSCVTCTG